MSYGLTCVSALMIMCENIKRVNTPSQQTGGQVGTPLHKMMYLFITTYESFIPFLVVSPCVAADDTCGVRATDY